MPYGQASVTVSSTTVPVQIIPVTGKTSWVMKPRVGSTTILVFPFSGPVPGTPPAAAMELVAGTSMGDADNLMSYETDSMQQGWAAVLESAGSATVDAIWKP